jgi:hypothetical protein
MRQEMQEMFAVYFRVFAFLCCIKKSRNCNKDNREPEKFVLYSAMRDSYNFLV